VGDFSDAAGEREMALKCGSLPRDAGDLTGRMRGHIEWSVGASNMGFWGQVID